jgi:large subunit ribosomal protein L23
MSIFNIIKKPVVTEKSQILEATSGKYTFYVNDRATKIDVRTAVERLYGVEVVKVNVINTRAKVRVNGRRGAQIKRKERTKMIITLKNGQRIQDLMKIVTK